MLRFFRIYSLIFIVMSMLLMAGPLYGEQQSKGTQSRTKPVFGFTLYPVYRGIGMGYFLRVRTHKYYLLGALGGSSYQSKNNFNYSVGLGYDYKLFGIRGLYKDGAYYEVFPHNENGRFHGGLISTSYSLLPSLTLRLEGAFGKVKLSGHSKETVLPQVLD